MPRTFASDNNSGIHPRVLAAIAAANEGHVRAYGDDPLTARLAERMSALFGRPVETFPVFNGTGANVLGLAALLRPFDAVLCAEGAHIAVDECNAPERFTSAKMVTIPTPDGKLTPEILAPRVVGVGVEHHAQPRVVSVAQCTELGTVYTREELAALRRFCDAHSLALHMDGARLANAVASIEGHGRDFSASSAADAVASSEGHRRDLSASSAANAVVTLGSLEAATYGVDVLSFGGTKNGAMAAEAVVFLREGLARDFRFVRKQGMQLASKMRFVSAQLLALIEDDLWLQNARHANAMAALLAREAAKVEGVRIVQRREANEVFAKLPRAAIAPLQEGSFFETWDEASDVVRWVCSWDTTEEDVRAFVETMGKIVPGAR